MKEFGIGGVIFLVLAIIGLALLVTGIIFVIKNIKWKREKDKQGLSSTGNVVGIVCFLLMSVFGGIWLLCFGIAAITFFIMAVL